MECFRVLLVEFSVEFFVVPRCLYGFREGFIGPDCLDRYVWNVENYGRKIFFPPFSDV